MNFSERDDTLFFGFFSHMRFNLKYWDNGSWRRTTVRQQFSYWSNQQSMLTWDHRRPPLSALHITDLRQLILNTLALSNKAFRAVPSTQPTRGSSSSS